MRHGNRLSSRMRPAFERRANVSKIDARNLFGDVSRTFEIILALLRDLAERGLLSEAELLCIAANISALKNPRFHGLRTNFECPIQSRPMSAD